MLTIHIWQVATIVEVTILDSGRSFYYLNNDNNPVIQTPGRENSKKEGPEPEDG